MDDDKLTSQLIEKLKQPFFQCQIAVRDLSTYYNTIVECLRQKGCEGEKLISEVRKNVRSICPKCCTWVDWSTIGMVSNIQMRRREGMATRISGHGVLSRLLEGYCPNKNCCETTTVLLWGRNQPIQDFLESIIASSIPPQNSEPILSYLSDPTVQYASDVVYVQGTKGCEGHHWTGMRSRQHELFIVVSVIKVTIPDPQSIKTVFTTGYCDFLSQVMSLADYETGNTAFLHWIFAYGQKGRRLDIAFFDKMTNERMPGSCLLPRDLLSQDEIQKLMRI